MTRCASTAALLVTFGMLSLQGCTETEPGGTDLAQAASRAVSPPAVVLLMETSAGPIEFSDKQPGRRSLLRQASLQV